MVSAISVKRVGIAAILAAALILGGFAVKQLPVFTGAGAQTYPAYAEAALIDQSGHTFALKDFQDKPVLVNFLFTGCSVYCPVQAGELVLLYDELEEKLGPGNFQFVSISLTPEFDTPESLDEFRRRFSAERPNWAFSKGSPEDLDAMVAALNVRITRGARKDLDVVHEPDIHVLEKGNVYEGRYGGVPLKQASIARAIIAASKRPAP